MQKLFFFGGGEVNQLLTTIKLKLNHKNKIIYIYNGFITNTIFVVHN